MLVDFYRFKGTVYTAESLKKIADENPDKFEFKNDKLYAKNRELSDEDKKRICK